MAYVEATVAVFLVFNAGLWVLLFNNSLYLSIVIMHASGCVLAQPLLSVSPRLNDVIFKFELKSFLAVIFFVCFFSSSHPTYALVQISKASIKVRHVRTWEWLHVWFGLSGADTGITLTIQNPMRHKANMHEKTKTDSVWKIFFFLSDLGDAWNFLQEERFPHHYHNNETLFGGEKSKLFGLAAIQYLTCNSDAILFFIHIYDTVIERDVLKTTGRRSSFCVSLVCPARRYAGYFQTQHSKKNGISLWTIKSHLINCQRSSHNFCIFFTETINRYSHLFCCQAFVISLRAA